MGYLKLWKWLGESRGSAPEEGAGGLSTSGQAPRTHKLSNRRHEQLLRDNFVNPRRVREWRDIYSQLIYGARSALLVGVSAAFAVDGGILADDPAVIPARAGSSGRRLNWPVISASLPAARTAVCLASRAARMPPRGSCWPRCCSWRWRRPCPWT